MFGIMPVDRMNTAAMKSDSAAPQLSVYDLQMIGVLRNRLADIDQKEFQEVLENSYLYRFLFARDFNAHEAELMIKKHLEWQKIHDTSSILSWQPSSFLIQYFQYEIIKRGRKSPVLLLPLGNWDIKLACDTVGKETLVRFIVQSFIKCYETLRDTLNNNNDKAKLPQFTIVITLENLQVMRQLSCPRAWSVIMESLRLFEANYPEIFHVGFIIDAPRLFALIFNLIKPILSSHTLSKLKISSNPSQWMSQLHDIVPRDDLPQRLGGTWISQINIFNENPYNH